jgi:hypothetical protein
MNIVDQYVQRQQSVSLGKALPGDYSDYQRQPDLRIRQGQVEDNTTRLEIHRSAGLYFLKASGWPCGKATEGD